MPKLEITNISKTYKKGAVKALDDFSVTLTPGVYELLGPNGAGKSTLMNIITDNLNSDSGKVLYNDEDIKKLGKNYRTVLGYMPQQQGLYDDFTLNRFL
jgi:ABC-2 type transport system ATP-binding protein